MQDHQQKIQNKKIHIDYLGEKMIQDEFIDFVPQSYKVFDTEITRKKNQDNVSTISAYFFKFNY